MTKDTGGPAFRPCRVCREDFQPKPFQIRKSDYECPACKRTRQNTANANRDLASYGRAQYARPEVRAKMRAYFDRKKTDPEYRLKRSARRKICTEISAGRVRRGACETCGQPNAEAHHRDYLKPLDVRWLCRKHHFQEEHRAN